VSGIKPGLLASVSQSTVTVNKSHLYEVVSSKEMLSRFIFGQKTALGA
jgi:hypothetical protein